MDFSSAFPFSFNFSAGDANAAAFNPRGSANRRGRIEEVYFAVNARDMRAGGRIEVKFQGKSRIT